MDFVLTTGWEDGVAKLTEEIVKRLADGRKLLWLVCGGSNVPAAVQIMDSVPQSLSAGLSVGLTDERYGPAGHPDSNWQQLRQAGFRAKQAAVLPVLQPEPAAGLATTARRYGGKLAEAFERADSVIGQFGIGEDGHIAGILPASPAAQETAALAAGYQSTPFERITMTFPAFLHLDAAYAFVFGAAKRGALEQLKNQALSPVTQPAQILKQLPAAYVYNDQIGESA